MFSSLNEMLLLDNNMELDGCICCSDEEMNYCFMVRHDRVGCKRRLKIIKIRESVCTECLIKLQCNDPCENLKIKV